LFAVWYPHLCEISERAGQRAIRRNLIGRAVGRTLEIGAGSGLNLRHYTAEVTELIVSEPSPHMRKHLGGLLNSDPPPVGSSQLIDTGSPTEAPPREGMATSRTGIRC
jgi:hypothetical protein